MFELTNKVALVTGATRGIGQSIASTLSKQGAFVIGTATTAEGAQKIQQYFDEQGLRGRGVALDVTNSEAVDAFYAQLSQDEQVPNILVNNAGITRDNLLLRMEDEEWQRVIDTNLTAIYRLTKICLRSMFKARWGRIISIGSVVGSSGNSGQANYCAAKAGVIGFSKSLAQEIGSRGITVNVIAPGFIDTDMTQGLPDLVKEEMLKRIPLRRMGDPKDIAAAVAFLASDQAAYITGETLQVNGGLYMD